MGFMTRSLSSTTSLRSYVTPEGPAKQERHKKATRQQNQSSSSSSQKTIARKTPNGGAAATTPLKLPTAFMFEKKHYGRFVELLQIANPGAMLNKKDVDQALERVLTKHLHNKPHRYHRLGRNDRWKMRLLAESNEYWKGK